MGGRRRPHWQGELTVNQDLATNKEAQGGSNAKGQDFANGVNCHRATVEAIVQRIRQVAALCKKLQVAP